MRQLLATQGNGLSRNGTRLAAGFAAALAVLSISHAGEGGVSHVQPGATATLLDVPPTDAGWFFKSMAVNYQGDASARLPLAIGVASNAKVKSDTIVIGGGYGFDRTILGGAHYSVGAFLPYSQVDISVSSPVLAGVRVSNTVSGTSDATLIPVMLAWKLGDLQYHFLLPIYAPTGNYKAGRLGNTGLNYWTTDPTLGVAYANPRTGLSATAHAGYAINTENKDTHYRSGDIFHLDASAQQILPLGSGFLNLGLEAWHFQQATCDSGSGATLGCFKGDTSGIGPVIGYIQPVGQQKLLVELKWLHESDTKNRLNGDFIWLKAVYKF